MTDIYRKTVLVTGACGGFGTHMTKQFLARDCQLMVTDLDACRLDDLNDEVQRGAGRIMACLAVDLSTADGCRTLADSCAQQGIVPDLLINNAGIAVAGRHDCVPGDRWETLMQLNLLAPMRLSALFLPQMIARGSGHIVNISSLAGWIGPRHLASYVASKFGLRGFGEALAADLKPHNIRVSNVYPSFSRTPILDSEQFGIDKPRVVPDHMVSDPAAVIASMIEGIERNRMHIFPDKLALSVHYLKRFFPWSIPLLSRRLDEQATPAD